MASNWRLNVWRLGWSNGPFRKIARVRGGFLFDSYVGDVKIGPFNTLWEVPLGTDFLGNPQFVILPFGNRPFPYRLNVDPD